MKNVDIAEFKISNRGGSRCEVRDRFLFDRLIDYEHLKTLGRVVFLDVPLEVVRVRIGDLTERGSWSSLSAG